MHSWSDTENSHVIKFSTWQAKLSTSEKSDMVIPKFCLKIKLNLQLHQS
ncbi:uncharacterized protein PGTG_07455 [Puccinia graminis f. sp. tritici CRL 75-36-700-3]|uniref:Uncharacterized protein n=1 Tax=Puccinia graminis f. sp. tritici (strain CRL 75-36-700-3 / race SCCL) TaxID=418459 RepID=E3KCZ1_PUCGT|nr:uncharacterized protein PGTG_07455 [Puccinia graminis f. sp. tritici CRL 75-36-700-3]EFP82058.1 hypothetical protein PGTG_07455 [Puccinia graminis f. sp. tritici CRL 75-36-700-3]